MNLQNPFKEQQSQLLTSFLLNKERKNFSIEFILTSVCNQGCEYCYLYKHGKELYPPAANNFDNILKNFPILLDWLDEQGFEYENYDLFTGEYFNMPIWQDIFEIIYNREKKRIEEEGIISPRFISIPTNMSFLMDPVKTEKVEKWINRFRAINSDISLSCSVEGPEELEALERPLKVGERKTEENFYKRFNEFRKKYTLASHPMITRNFVKNYKTNYDWWIDTTIENNITQYNGNGKEVYCIPMFLEVRDAEQWDEQSLKDYENFLYYVAEKDLKTLHNNDLDDFAYHFFDDFTDPTWKKKIPGLYTHLQPYIIGYPILVSGMTCSIQKGPVFRVGDLAYVPCHRTCYPDFVYGYFQTENNKIVGLEANNPILAVKIKQLNPNRSVLKCSSCPLKAFCMKGCLGSQYEHTHELFCAEDTVCDMIYTKYKTIHNIALKYNLYEWLEKDTNISIRRKEFINYVKGILEQLE